VADPRSPATIRITRPYSSEDEFIEGDFPWIGRSSIVLPNSPARTTGEVVRFEVVLTSGLPVFRGEGSVVTHHPPGGARPPGLEVRFTRIDARSKLILDKIRERRGAFARTGEITAAQVAAYAARPQASATDDLPTLAVGTRSQGIQLPASVASERRVVERASPPPKVAAPPNREEILERLRARAKHLAETGGFTFKRRSS
jgi:hypothetical protein